MKKIRFALIIIFLKITACGGGPYIEYDEDIVLVDVTHYLEEKYGDEHFEYNVMGHYGGTDFVNVSFYAVDDPDEIMFDVQWRENGDLSDNYELLKKERDERKKDE